MKKSIVLFFFSCCIVHVCRGFENVYTHPALTDCALNKSVCTRDTVLNDWGFNEGINTTLDFDGKTVCD